MGNDRYVVVPKQKGRMTLYYILDDQTNRLITDGFARKEDAERIAKKINREIQNNGKH